MAQPPHQNVVHPWQGNPGSAPYNPLLNGNGSNYSSRTGSPAQPPPAVSGLTMGVQQMSLKQNLPLPNGNRVANGPLNGNSGPPVNGNQNVRGTFQHQQTQFQPLPTPQFQTQPTSPPQGPPQFQAPQQQFPPKEPANVPPSNFQVPQQRPFTAPQSNFPQTNSGPPTSFGSQTPQGPNFGSNPLPQANSGPVFGSQPPPQPRSGSSTGTQPPSQMNSGPSFGSNPLPQVSSGPNFGSQPLQTSSGPNFGSKPLPQANPGPNFGSQPLPQVNSGPNFGSKPLPQVNSGPNFGSQPLPQANPGPNFGSKPLVQANSGQNFGSKPLHQTSSGPVFGGQPPPQPSSGPNFGNQPLPQANPGPNFGAQPPPQTNSGPLQQKRPLYPAGTPMQPAMLQRPQVQSPLLQQPLAQQQQQQFNGFSPDGSKMQYQGQQSVLQTGFNKIWGHETLDLMQNRHILPPAKVDPPSIKLNHQFHEAVNCNPDIFRCTLNKVPESNNLLQKSRLPLGVLIHPFRDLNNLPVITSSTIVRCRVCRTYINPFVYFVDSKKWKCNLCYRVNDLPDEFLYDPVSKTYGDPTRRPEVKSSTIEFIAPSEYTLRPPQPAIFLFLLDVSSIAQQSGYLQVVCDVITEQLDKLPGDTRKQMGFIAYNSSVNFYNIAENFNQPHEVTVLDLEDIFLPFPDNLVVNLKLCKDLIKDLLTQLPKRFENNHDPYSSLGAALQAAYKLLSPTGGRITVFQTCLPNYGPGCLQPREDPNNRSSKDIQHLGPATDFYKRLALDCSGQQIAVDLFLLNSQYSDLATLSGISKFSGGCIHHFPLFNASKPNIVKSFKQCFERYLTRKIGFEAVMRVRCTRGLQIHTFHGNFFVRSTDLLSLPNINPDAGFGLQISYEESLVEVKTVCFQAALLYTSSNGERRIRVHTLCLPVSASLSEIILSADVQCIIGLLTKMAVDRSLASNLSDARDAFINATVDILSAYKLAQNLPGNASGLLVPSNLSLFPLYILALLKHTAFRTGTSTRLDDRVFAMCEMKTLPLDQLMKYIYPDFYCIDCLFNRNGENVAEPSRLQLSAEHLDTRSVFCLDGGSYVIIYIGSNVPPPLLSSILGVSSINEVPEVCYSLPELKTPDNEALHAFIDTINEDKPYAPIIQVIRDSSATRPLLTEKFVDDRNDSSLSYYEFLQHIKTQIK